MCLSDFSVMLLHNHMLINIAVDILSNVLKINLQISQNNVLRNFSKKRGGSPKQNVFAWGPHLVVI